MAANDKTNETLTNNSEQETTHVSAHKGKGTENNRGLLVGIMVVLILAQIGTAVWVICSRCLPAISIHCILFFTTILLDISSSKKAATTSQTGEEDKNCSAPTSERDGKHKTCIIAEYEPFIISIAGSMCVTFILVFFICTQETFFGMASCLVLALGAGATIEKSIDAITKAFDVDASTPERIKGGVMTGFYGVLLVGLFALLYQAPDTVTQLLFK